MENPIPEIEQKELQTVKHQLKFNKKFYFIGLLIFFIVIFTFLLKLWLDANTPQKQISSKIPEVTTYISKPITPSPEKSVYFLNEAPTNSIPSMQPTLIPILPASVTITSVSPALTKKEIITLVSKLISGNSTDGWTECQISKCPFTTRLTTALNTATDYANKIEKVTPGAYTYSPILREQNSGNPVVDSITSSSYGKVDIKISLGSENTTPEYTLVVLWNGNQWLIDDVLCDGNKSEYHTPYPQPCT